MSVHNLAPESAKYLFYKCLCVLPARTYVRHIRKYSADSGAKLCTNII